jgi:hypothetical protein
MEFRLAIRNTTRGRLRVEVHEHYTRGEDRDRGRLQTHKIYSAELPGELSNRDDLHNLYLSLGLIGAIIDEVEQPDSWRSIMESLPFPEVTDPRGSEPTG